MTEEQRDMVMVRAFLRGMLMRSSDVGVQTQRAGDTECSETAGDIACACAVMLALIGADRDWVASTCNIGMSDDSVVLSDATVEQLIHREGKADA